MKYYLADTHIGHENIIRLCNRPFKSVDEMNDTIINNWNSVVKDNDEVYIIGDFAYKNANNLTHYLKQLKGKKYLITGNHDRIDPEARKCFEWIRSYAEIIDNGQKIVLFHYPILEWNGYFRGTIHIYGHVHNNVDNESYKALKNLKNAYNAGADILGFTPRTLTEVIEMNELFNAAH